MAKKVYYKSIMVEIDLSGTESIRAIIRNCNLKKVACEFFLTEQEAHEWVAAWIHQNNGVLATL
jgi:hypothetical protein